MPPLNYYISQDIEFPEKDENLIKTKAKGKTRTVTMTKRDVDKGKVKNSIKWDDEILNWISSFNLSKPGLKILKDSASFDGKVKDFTDYDLFITVNSKRYKATLAVEAGDGVLDEEVEPPAATFANSKVKSACSGAEFKAKIKSISLAGKTETGHGKVPYLGGALHAHVTNTHSLAWEWKGDKMHIVATGKKNNQNKQQKRGGKGPNLKTCQYDWDEG